MKILVVDNMLVRFDPNGVPGGTERRTISDAVSFAREGHEVFLTVAAHPEWYKENRTYEGVNLWCLHEQGKEVSAVTPREWQKRVTSRIDKYIGKYGKPDVVHYGCNSFYWLAKHLMTKHGLPLNTQIGNYLSGNALYDSGRLKDLFFLKSLGAHFTFNTRTCAEKFQAQIDALRDKGVLSDKVDHSVPLANYVNKNNAGVGFVGNPKDGAIRVDRGYAVIAARADPVKKVGSFAWVDFPLKVYLKYRTSSDKNGFFKKLVERLQKNPNIEVLVDQPYATIMKGVSKARAVIVSWPDETFGLSAFEACSFGVPAVVFRRSKKDPNATYEFLSEIEEPPQFAYDDPEWKKKLREFMANGESLKERQARADACRKRYSYRKYVAERLFVLESAIKLHRKVNK